LRCSTQSVVKMTESTYRAVRDDFLSKPLYPVENVTLMGSKCAQCGEVFLGKAIACQNCQSDELRSLALSREGTLFSFTVVRNKPPGDYKGAGDPFQPYPVGLVELPEGVRILCVLDGDFDSLQIGMPLVLCVYPLYTDAQGVIVLSYAFKSSSGTGRRS
jgi:uncharacterized protein